MRVLQVVCSYFPQKVGGTEVYVHSLNLNLASLGCEVAVVYFNSVPNGQSLKYSLRKSEYQGIPVYIIDKDTRGLKTSELYFESDLLARAEFEKVIGLFKPDIIHFHHFLPTDIAAAVDAAFYSGTPSLLTYHTPMMSCAQGLMLYKNKYPCSGRMDNKNCLFCVQRSFGLPYWISFFWSRLHNSIASVLFDFASRIKLKSRFVTWLMLPWMLKKKIEITRLAFSRIDHFVATSNWVRRMLLTNGIDEKKISFLRQGTDLVSQGKSLKSNKGWIRLIFLGRIAPYKGLHILLKAVSLLGPEYDVDLSVYGLPGSSSEEKYLSALKNKFIRENRIHWEGLLEPDKKIEVLQDADAVIIPSLWLETGPLVLLEAWAAKVPVIASRIGSIEELIVGGRGGILFEPGDWRGLSNIIKNLALDRQKLAQLRDSVPEPKSNLTVAVEMQELYKQLISRSNQ
jgi:glycosyltransferase involved in cell wall biosynthesis